MTDTKNTVSDANWLDEAARYFENRDTGGEDMAFWANASNAARCRSIAQSLRASIPGGVGVPAPEIWQARNPSGAWVNCVNEETARYVAHPHDGEVRPLYAAPSNPVISDEPTHRHKKRGTEYVLIGIGRMQAENWHDMRANPHDFQSVDMREVAIYRSATDPTEIWVRPREEFEDGRFEILTAALSVKPQSGEE